MSAGGQSGLALPLLKPVPKGSHKNAPEAAVRVLMRTGNEAIGYGDAGLLHMVCEELGWPHESWRTEKRVLDAIDRHHEGVLVKRYFRARRGVARVFYLPGKEPRRNKELHDGR